MNYGILGGTFDVIHDGHMALLNTAFMEAEEEVTVGVTSDEMANESRDRYVNSYEMRSHVLRGVLYTLENIYGIDSNITEMDDGKSLAIDSDADFIVLSPEKKTQIRAIEINLERVKNGRERLEIVKAPMVRDYMGRKISSTRIANGEIGKHGEKL